MNDRTPLASSHTPCALSRAGLLAALLVAPPALSACSSAEALDPAPAATAPPGTTTAPDPGPGPTGVAPKRTVLLRSPVGGPPNNLLVDGDFEMSVGSGGGQYGWRMFTSSGAGEVAMTAETGGLCRSGLTCARLEGGRLLYGRGTSAPGDKDHVMGMFARLPEGASCAEVDLIAVDCDSFAAFKKAKPDPELDAGWCRYRATFGPSTSAVCLYVQSSLAPGQVALVDAAVLGPNDGTVPYSAVPDEPLSPETLATMARVRDLVRRTRPFGRRPITGPGLVD